MINPARGSESGKSPAAGLLRPAPLMWFAGARLIPGLLSLVSIPIWLGLFGTAAFGQFAIANVIVTVAASFCTGWLRQAALRFTGLSGHGLLDHSLPVLLSPIVASAAISVGGLAVFAGRAFSASTALLIFALAVTFALYLLTQTAVQRDGAAGRYAVADSTRAGLTLLASALLSRTELAGLEALLIASVVGNLAAIAGTASSPSHWWERTQSHEVARDSWTFGWPLSIWLGLSALTIMVDRLILQVVADPHLVGLYAATAEIVVRGYAAVSAPVLLSLHPSIMKAFNESRIEDARQGITVGTQVLMVLGLAFVGVLVLVGPAVLGPIIGGERPSRTLLLLLGAGAALWQLALLVHKPLELQGQTRRMLVLAAVALACEVVVSSLLVNAWGANGVALGFLAGCVAYVVTTHWGLKREGRRT